MENPWKRLLFFSHTYLGFDSFSFYNFLCFSCCSPVVVLALLLEINLLLVRGVIPSTEFVLILRGTFPKEPVNTRWIFEHSTSKLFFGLFGCVNGLGYLITEFFPKEIFFFFLKEFRFCFGFDCDKLFITPYSTLSLLWHETAVLAWPKRSTGKPRQIL